MMAGLTISDMLEDIDLMIDSLLTEEKDLHAKIDHLDAGGGYYTSPRKQLQRSLHANQDICQNMRMARGGLDKARELHKARTGKTNDLL